ncbi:site-2 protease family protein [Sanguibacter antarcticus]|uniref:site-2 protease family protein n=1 Tax=Sanguibacter antarcticus TaxID=372484 RepID=UPI0014748413|nr:site-2 protease family protein [Sanguibacter antarcticus]
MDKRTRWVVGRVAGAPVVLQPSALVMVAVLTVLFLPTVRSMAPSLGSMALVGAFVVVALLMVSVFLHELAHALVARARGMQVRELALTLWGGHTAFTDTGSTPFTSGLVAVVGPLTNLSIALVAWWGYTAQDGSGLVALLLYVTAYANAAVGVFNLLPGLPLDGGQVVEAVVWGATGSRFAGTTVAAWTGRVIAVLVVVAAIAVPSLRGQDVNLLMVVWAAFIGSFMWSAASQALSASRTRALAEALDPRVLGRPAVAVDARGTVADVRAALLTDQGAGLTACVLTADGHPVGYVDDGALAGVPSDVASTTPAWSVGVGLPPGSIVDVDLRGIGLHSAVVRAARHTNVLVVTQGSQVVGLLSVTDVARAMHLD